MATESVVDVSGEDVQVRNIEKRIHETGLDQGAHPVHVVRGEKYLSGNNDSKVADEIEGRLQQGASGYEIHVTRGPQATHDPEGKQPIEQGKVGTPTSHRIETEELVKGERFPGVVVAQINKGDDTDRVGSKSQATTKGNAKPATTATADHKSQVGRVEADRKIALDETVPGEPMPGVVVGTPTLPGVESPKAPSADAKPAVSPTVTSRTVEGSKPPTA